MKSKITGRVYAPHQFRRKHYELIAGVILGLPSAIGGTHAQIVAARLANLFEADATTIVEDAVEVCSFNRELFMRRALKGKTDGDGV